MRRTSKLKMPSVEVLAELALIDHHLGRRLMAGDVNLPSIQPDLLSLGPLARHLVSGRSGKPDGFQMKLFRASRLPRTLPALAATLLALSAPALAAEEADAPRGPAVTVLKAAKSCFANIVEVSGIIMPREETSVRPERLGLKVADVMADAGDTVTAGQTLARLNLPEGGSINVTAPVAGIISVANAVVGAFASGKGEPLFNIIARSEYDLVGLVPTTDLARLQVRQPATVRVIGINSDLDGQVRRIAPTVESQVQLGQAFIGITTNRHLLVNSSARALIKVGQSCNVAVPL